MFAVHNFSLMNKQEQHEREAAKLLFIHPHRLGLYLVLAGVTFAFLALCAAYLYSRVTQGIPPVKLPFIFLLNSILLVAASTTIHFAIKAYKDDDTQAYQRFLVLTLSCTLLFVIAQYYGWQQMWAMNMPLTGIEGPSTGYLYAISALHVIHVLGGLPFLILFTITAFVRLREPVSVLIYFSDPIKKMRLNLLALYWHYLDVLWIFLILFFWINYLCCS